MEFANPATATVGPVAAMGIAFPNPVGLSAGFDRTGELIPQLGTEGFGFVEIGTVTPQSRLADTLKRGGSPMRIGISIASARTGIDDEVIADYVAMLKSVHGLCDYVVANLTASTHQRNGNTAGVEGLVVGLANARDELSAASGLRVPLLLKIDPGPQGTAVPAAMPALRDSGLDGAVVVSSCLDRLREVSAYLRGLTVISVGGVKSAACVRSRLAAGAALVQAHTAYAEGGPAWIAGLLKELAQPA